MRSIFHDSGLVIASSMPVVLSILFLAWLNVHYWQLGWVWMQDR